MPETDQSCFPDLSRSLSEQGLAVDVRTELVIGEPDTRLHAGVPSAPGTVELLGPVADLPLPPRWQAIRVDSGSRSVWEGPSRQGSQSELRTFIWELACLRRDRLSRRWRRLD